LECKKHNRQAQRFGCNSVPRIITPPLIGKLQDLCLPILARARTDSLGLDEPSRDGLDELKATNARLCRHKLYPAPEAGAGFIIFIYTKSATCPSSKICRVIYAFVHALSVNEGPPFSSQSSQLPKNLHHSAFLVRYLS